jgi:type III secretion protein U
MSEKTEQPTQKRLRDARKKGQVAYSKDFTQTCLIMAIFGYLLVDGGRLMGKIGELIILPGDFLTQPFINALKALLIQYLVDLVIILLPFVLIVLIIGIFADALQVGIFFAFEAIKPSGKKLNVVQNAKNIFSKKNFIEFLKSSIKVVLLSVLVYFIIKDHLDILMKVPLGGIPMVGAATASMVKIMIINISIAYVVIALFDLIWQRLKFRKDNMMTKDEVKREYKEQEGDPHIKGKRKQLHKEMAMGDAGAQTKKSSAVISNPTHYAVAIYYKESETPLPIVLTKGEGETALYIIRVAHEAGIPVFQNIALARALSAKAEIDQYIPLEFMEPVAEVLRMVKELSQDY